MKYAPLLLLYLLQHCNHPPQENELIKRLLINSYRVECQGFILQECLLIKEGAAIPNGRWSNFYEDIEGFTFTPGFIYDIEVEKIKRDPRLQDVGLYRYVFVQLNAKTAVD